MVYNYKRKKMNCQLETYKKFTTAFLSGNAGKVKSQTEYTVFHSGDTPATHFCHHVFDTLDAHSCALCLICKGRSPVFKIKAFHITAFYRSYGNRTAFVCVFLDIGSNIIQDSGNIIRIDFQSYLIPVHQKIYLVTPLFQITCSF